MQGLKRETRSVLKKLSSNNPRLQFMQEVHKWIRADSQISADQAKAHVKEFLVKHNEVNEDEVN
jgi:hypothetical protein